MQVIYIFKTESMYGEVNLSNTLEPRAKSHAMFRTPINKQDIGQEQTQLSVQEKD